MTRRLAVLAPLLLALCAPAPAAAQEEPDPAEFTPPGYAFCGWRDFAAQRWVTRWDDSLVGAYTVLFAREMSCRSARRNYARVRFAGSRPVRTGYRCQTIASRHEFADERCTKRGTRRVSFRWQTGA